jgi:hypothetical protein
MTRDQVEIALARLNPQYAYRWLDDGSYEWRGPGDVLSDAEIQSAWDAYTAEQVSAQAVEDADATRRAQLIAARATLQTIIDTPNGSLSNAQVVDAVRVLCRAVLWIAERGIRKGTL